MGKNIGRLIRKTESILEASQEERRRAEFKAREEQWALEAKRRQEEYDRPLPEFSPRIPREIRTHLLTYVAKVASDAVRNILSKSMENERRYASWYYGKADIEYAVQRWKEFKGIPVQEFALAVRLVELKPLSKESTGITVAVLYVMCKTLDPKLVSALQHHYFSRQVPYRLKNNLLKNIPKLEEILGREFDVRVYDQDMEFAELKKFGYEAEPGKKRVVHLEIF